MVITYCQADLRFVNVERAAVAAGCAYRPNGDCRPRLPADYHRTGHHTCKVVDAGIGAPSHAAEAMEMGASACLVNTAIAVAGNP